MSPFSCHLWVLCILASTTPTDLEIDELDYFICQEFCEHLPLIEKNGLQTANVYGVKDETRKVPESMQYNQDWVYTTPVQKRGKSVFFTQFEVTEWDCVLRINKGILNDLTIRNQMMINSNWLKGKVCVDPSKTLYYGGDQSVSLESDKRYSNAEILGFFLRFQNDNSTNLINLSLLNEALRICLNERVHVSDTQYISMCEVLFRDHVPIKYIDGYAVIANKSSVLLQHITWLPVKDINASSFKVFAGNPGTSAVEGDRIRLLEKVKNEWPNGTMTELDTNFRGMVVSAEIEYAPDFEVRSDAGVCFWIPLGNVRHQIISFSPKRVTKHLNVFREDYEYF